MSTRTLPSLPQSIPWAAAVTEPSAVDQMEWTRQLAMRLGSLRFEHEIGGQLVGKTAAAGPRLEVDHLEQVEGEQRRVGQPQLVEAPIHARPYGGCRLRCPDR
jgi:hypothetical protein